MEFNRAGNDIIVYSGAKIINPQNLALGDRIIIDDFTFLYVGPGSSIGSFVHIAAYANITGGGRLTLGDFSSVSSHCALFTAGDDFLGGGLTNPCVPRPFREPSRSFINLGRHCMLGAHTIVLAGENGVTIGEGTVVGAGSVVKQDLEPWSVYAGNPLRFIRARPRDTILKMEELLLKKLYNDDGLYVGTGTPPGK